MTTEQKIIRAKQSHSVLGYISFKMTTYCWTIIAEQNGRKSIADNGFLTYEEADHFRLELIRRHPDVAYFVARHDLDRSVLLLRAHRIINSKCRND